MRMPNNDCTSGSRGRLSADLAWYTMRRVRGSDVLVGHWDSRVINNLARMRAGNAPQRFNPDKGGTESMELSHEPIPARDGGTQFVPRWPQDHAAVDPYRRPGY